jgi:hypothetical protein
LGFALFWTAALFRRFVLIVRKKKKTYFIRNCDQDEGFPKPSPRVPLHVAPLGMYRVVLFVDGKESTHGLRIEPDPTLPSALIAAEDGEAPPPRKKKLVPDK